LENAEVSAARYIFADDQIAALMFQPGTVYGAFSCICNPYKKVKCLGLFTRENVDLSKYPLLSQSNV